MSGINDWSSDVDNTKSRFDALKSRSAKSDEGKSLKERRQLRHEEVLSHIRSEGNLMKGSFLYQTKKPQIDITSPSAAENSLKSLGFSPSVIRKIIENNSAAKAIRLNFLGINTGYIKDLIYLDEAQLEEFLRLLDTGLSIYSARQLAKSDKAGIERALVYKQEGIPELSLADVAALPEKNSARVNNLLNDDTISKYYIGQLAALDDERYENAIILIREYEYSAPSAIDAVRKDDFSLEKAISEKPKKMKKELNPDIERILLERAEILYNEYARNIADVNADVQKKFGHLVGEEGKLSAREKGIDSILRKLISKYEKGDLNINADKQTPEEITKICNDAITDAYGTRLKIDSINTEQAKQIFENKGLDYDTVCSFVQQAIDNGEINQIPHEYMEAIEELKVKQTTPVFEALIDRIKNEKDFNIKEINNYGDELSCYFTGNQVKKIFYECYDKSQQEIDIISLDKSFNDEVPEVSYNEESETYEPSVTEDKKEQKIEANFQQKDAIKASGYTSVQFNIIHKLKHNKYGNGEFQIRGTKVNAFANAEHIPYDIKQGKITTKDKEYEKIYSVIQNMDETSYKKYNKYLTKVYQCLRMQELGLDVKIPEPDMTLYYKNKMPIPQELINNLSYESLISYN